MRHAGHEIEIGEVKRAQFETLFEEFLEEYPATQHGQLHIHMYERVRDEGRRNFQQIVAAVGRGEDVTERVLLKLLPYADTAAARETGMWLHVAPVFAADVRRKFEAAGWTNPDDWPRVASAILTFVVRCERSPEELATACEDFASLPYSTGFQAGTLSPILNALRPEEYLIVNGKSRAAINLFAGTSHSQRLRDYPATNATGWRVIHDLAPTMREFDVPELKDADLFDMFSHWLTAVKGFSFRSVRYWKIAPGEKAWNWDAWREGSFITIGWDALGDVSGLTRSEFDAIRDAVVASRQDWTKSGADQVWRFAHIAEGDRVVANRGFSEVLGIGRVTGPYYFVEGERHGHRLPVEWEDLTRRSVEESGWRRTLVELDPEHFAAIRTAPTIAEGLYESDKSSARLTHKIADGGELAPTGYFSPRTFELLKGLHRDPTVAYYKDNKPSLEAFVIKPFRRLIRDVAVRLPARVTSRIETERRLFSRIPKNDFGRGGAWDAYWGAFYPKGSKRTADAQLLAWIGRDRLAFGFFIADYAAERRQQFLQRCRDNYQPLARLLVDHLSVDGLILTRHDQIVVRPDGTLESECDLTPEEWLQSPDQANFAVTVIVPRDQVLACSGEELSDRIAQVFEQLFPLLLLAVDDDPLTAITEYLGRGEAEVMRNPAYSLAECAAETHFEESRLAAWVRAIERKKQAIVYGPPGTGKTYMAERLAQHLIAGSDGFSEVLQFHPAYAYEDFIQGLRPEPNAEGGLRFDQAPGRFLDFCRRAQVCEGHCVLIIDEINRANLSRVFGEMMYLLEYRDREVPLAGGGMLRIPENVRIIGTMNTADRSIALVDHALRRRFAFLALYPDYDLLRRYHISKQTRFELEPLIQALTRLNRQIGDRDYAVGITFFLVPNLAEHIQDIWQMEIEPYLEEYFFDQRDTVEMFRWTRIREEIGQ